MGQLAAAERALAEEARTAGAPATAVNNLVAAGEQLDKQLADLQPLADDPAQAAAATARVEEMKRTATAANVEFANALLRDADARGADEFRQMPGGRAGGRTSALADLRSSVEASANFTDPVQSLGAARDALAKSQAFAAALPAAYSAQAASRAHAGPKRRSRPGSDDSTTTTSRDANRADRNYHAATDRPPAAAPTGVSASKRAQLSSIVSSGRSMAKQVIRMGERRNRDPKGERAACQELRQISRERAEDSARGANSDREFDELIKKANQTKAYIVFLQQAVVAANRPADRCAIHASCQIRTISQATLARICAPRFETNRVAQRLHFGARADFMLERNIADPKDRADRQDFAAFDPLVVDVGAVSGIQIDDPQLVGGQFDQAMRP